MAHDEQSSHEEHLAKIPESARRRRLEFYKLDPLVWLPVSIICISTHVSRESRKWHQYFHPLKPTGIHDLKNWFGTPNEAARLKLGELRPVAKDATAAAGLAAVNCNHLPPRPGFRFTELEQNQRLAVSQMARNLLFARLENEDLRRPEIEGVVQYMLHRVEISQPQAFVIANIVVCAEDEVVLDNIPVVVADNVLIYGNGRLTARGHTKLDAAEIKHLDA